MRLAQLGLLTKQSKWLGEGLASSRKLITQSAADSQNYSHYHSTNLAELLQKAGRGPEAETVLLEALSALARKNATPSRHSYSDPDASRAVLIELCSLYKANGRNADVVWLLENAPQWEAPDLVEVYKRSSESREHFGSIVASALMGVGRKEEALRILDATMDSHPDNDSDYELLLKLRDAPAAMSRLEALFARDAYQERPLIWKAELLRRSGNLEEAEKIARQAIAIDPSDGEQGKESRMRIYAVLSEIRAARGDAKEATFFADVVKAIRQSEHADDFHSAGLVAQAIKMYRDSLNVFANAYCIQSRLARELSQQGRAAEAEVHYRKAYELMPDSFGRVESHCFGCEKAFAGKKNQSVAEEVFTALAKKMPEKPQVHYLLGYLMQSTERYSEAAREFKIAVKLDPQYLNAWKHLCDVAPQANLTFAERQEAVSNIIRLDPNDRHGWEEFTGVADYAALWGVIDAALKQRATPPKTLLALPAAAEALKLKTKTSNSDDDRTIFRSIHRNRENEQKSSGEYLLRDNLFTQLIQFMSANRY